MLHVYDCSIKESQNALATRGVPMWGFGMYQYPILMPPKEANNQ